MIQTCLADHDQARGARAITEGLIKIGLHPWPDRLQSQTHRFACDSSEAFETQNIMGAYDRADLV